MSVPFDVHGLIDRIIFLLFFLNSITQLALQWLMFSGIILLFLVYTRPTVSPDDDNDEQQIYYFGRQISGSECRTAISITTVHAVYFLICAIVTVIVIFTDTNHAWIWAACFGIFGIVLTTAQYISQLWLTWRIRVRYIPSLEADIMCQRVASLSIPMMCIQSPGLIVFAFLIAIRRGTEWYNSITYLSAGILQSVLLVMCIIWKIREMREDTGGAVVLRDETAALLEDVEE